MTKERNVAMIVVDAFTEACPVPTPAQVSAWIEAHPQHAEAIKEAAADMLTLHLLTGDGDRSEPTEADVEADFQRAASAAGLDGPALSFPELIDGTGSDLPAIAQRLDIGVDVLVALEEGMVSTMPPKQFIQAFAQVVTMPQRTVLHAIDVSREMPRLAMAAKMGPSASLIARSWREVVSASSMRADRKDFWLAES